MSLSRSENNFSTILAVLLPAPPSSQQQVSAPRLLSSPTAASVRTAGVDRCVRPSHHPHSRPRKPAGLFPTCKGFPKGKGFPLWFPPPVGKCEILFADVHPGRLFLPLRGSSPSVRRQIYRPQVWKMAAPSGQPFYARSRPALSLAGTAKPAPRGKGGRGTTAPLEKRQPINPPSTVSTWPVMKLALSDARNAAAWAMSSGFPRRPRGVSAAS